MSLPANFPTSLDALANPTATTNRNDSGFELHAVVSRIHDILEALEAKVGIGAALPAANRVLRASASGVSTWGQAVPADLVGAGAGDANTVLRTTGGTTLAMGKIQTLDIDTSHVIGKQQLDYNLGGVDLVHTPTVGSADITTAQTFAIEYSTSVVVITVRLGGSVIFTSAGLFGIMVKIDGATNYLISTAAGGGAGHYGALAGGTLVFPSMTVSAGHTISLLYTATTTGHTLNIRGSSNPQQEGLSMYVVEIKR